MAAHDLVQAAQARKDAAQAALGRACGEWLPHVDAAANLGQENIQFPNDRSTSETKDSQRITARQLLFDFDRSTSGIRRAQVGLERAEAELSAVRQEIMLQGISAYLDVLRHTDRLRLARESEERIVTLTGIEETLVTKGAGLASDVLQAKSQLAGSRALRVRVEGQLAIAKNRFLTPIFAERFPYKHFKPADAWQDTNSFIFKKIRTFQNLCACLCLYDVTALKASTLN